MATKYCDSCSLPLTPDALTCNGCGKQLEHASSLPRPYQQAPGYPLPPYHKPLSIKSANSTVLSALPEVNGSKLEDNSSPKGPR